MGRHAFVSEPRHCRVYRDILEHPPPGVAVPKLFGFDERWNMPCVRHSGDLGRGRPFDGVDHYVMTLHVGGASARRLDPAFTLLTASAGALSLQEPGSSGTFASNGVVDYAHFYFGQSLLQEIAEESQVHLQTRLSDFFALFDQVAARDAASYLQRAHSESNPPTSMEMDTRGYLLALGVLRARNSSRSEPILLKSVASGCPLSIVMDFIEAHLSEPLRLSDLSDAVGMNPFHFTRVFKAEMGLTPSRFVVQRRLERGRELIEHSTLPLSEIAYQVGFSSQAHMTSKFKDRFGVTPGEMRRQAKL